MGRTRLTRLLAERSRVSEAVAADRLDRVIHDILCELRRGNEVPLPGLGTFKPGAVPVFDFDKAGRAKPPKRKGSRGDH